MARQETELLCPYALCLHCGAVRPARPLVADCCDDPFVLSVSIAKPEESAA